MQAPNQKDGIPYGVIAMNSLDGDVQNELRYGGGARNISEERAREDLKAEVTKEADALEEEATESFLEEFGQKCAEDQDMVDSAIENAYCARGYSDRDDFIECEMEKRGEFMEIDEPTVEGTYEGCDYAILWLGGAPIVYATGGFIGSANRPTSLCVPGAVDLDSGFSMDPDELGCRCYVVPKDWLQEGL